MLERVRDRIDVGAGIAREGRDERTRVDRDQVRSSRSRCQSTESLT
jgi:hypothetical protein